MKQWEFRKAIMSAFSTEVKRCRTAGGVSRETGLSIEDVIEYLEDHPDTFRVMNIKPGGHKIYQYIGEIDE